MDTAPDWRGETVTANRRTFFSFILGFVAWGCGCNSGKKQGHWAIGGKPRGAVESYLASMRAAGHPVPTIKSYAVSIHVASDGWPIERVFWSDRIAMWQRQPVNKLESWEVYENALKSRLSGAVELVPEGGCLSDATVMRLYKWDRNRFRDGDRLPQEGRKNA
jgi:hypothetical protein